MPGGSDIFEDILVKLEANGEITDKEFRGDTIRLLAELGRRTQCIADIKKQVDRLERNSVLIIAKRFPKASIAAAAFVFLFTVSVIAHLDLWSWLAELLGVPLP